VQDASELSCTKTRSTIFDEEQRSAAQVQAQEQTSTMYMSEPSRALPL
jgi:hypothetical protein